MSSGIRQEQNDFKLALERSVILDWLIAIRPTNQDEMIVVKQKYLRVNPVPGKFYVSEGWKAHIMVGEEILSQFQHGQQLARMVLAGPYNSRNEAERWNTENANGHAEIWQF
jgi:hypothetical protein